MNRYLEKGIKGYVSYQLRAEAYLKDNAQYDDVLVLEFNPQKIDFALLACDVIPKLIDAFQAYRAVMSSTNLALTDWPKIVEMTHSTGRDVDGRDGVFRITALNYWDKTLCQRAFGMTPAKIIQQLSTAVSKAEILNDGAYVVSLTGISDPEEQAMLDMFLRKKFNLSLS